MADPTDETARPSPAGKWRTFSNHHVTRVVPNSAESIPCYCWATDNHVLGEEVRTSPDCSGQRCESCLRD